MSLTIAYNAELRQRLAPLRAASDGLLYDIDSGQHRVIVQKQGNQLTLGFANLLTGEDEGLMSRIDLTRPLYLLAPYTQALLLTLLWQPQPKRVALLGLAGGRLSLVLYHHLPQLLIDNVEIDPIMGMLANECFGVTFDQRQRLFLADARAFLAERDTHEAPYDIIVMDAFSDASNDLDHLATSEFYTIAQRQLAPAGVLAVNLLRSDPQWAAKLHTFAARFAHVQVLPLKHALILFGSRERATPMRPAQLAQLLKQEYRFEMPLEELAAKLGPLNALEESLVFEIKRARVLHDSDTQ